jgi:DNA-directed RNA polymerase
MTEKKHKHRLPDPAREHLKAARDEMRKGIEALLPPNFSEHRRKTRKEMLMAAREVINHAIERIESHE